MKRNIGSIDRIFRLVGGLFVAICGIIFESYWGLIGVALLATAVFRYCPLYPILGTDTNKKDLQDT